MTNRTQPDSGRATGAAHIIRYALEMGLLWIDGDGRDKVREALDALDTLETQLEAIGAGGVSGPLVGRTDSKERAGRFTKKPVTIDAWLIDFGNKPLPDWVNEAFRTEAIDWCPAGEGLYINTLEGHMLGTNGSWLIQGVQGEMYACKPEIFAATYARASLAASELPEGITRDDTVHGETYFTAADMATAAAQGFRDGAASTAPPAAQAEGWRDIATAPKDGTLILVNFGIKGVRAVSWDSPFHDEVTEENGVWCVDDDKHGPYGLRGYNGDGPTAPTHWMKLPESPYGKN